MDDGFDVIIVSTNHSSQEEYWQKRLRSLRGVICKSDTVILAITEDWEGGAGNGLGTLYAYQKTQEKAKYKYHIDLSEIQKKGGAVALYHTAGYGKRLFPLTASEYNNKSAIKLPGFTEQHPLSILEAVILQTNTLFSKNKEGRLSVFWGDQLFVPSKNFNYFPNHHIDLLCKAIPTPSREEWKELQLSNYGILTTDQSGTRLFEKIPFDIFRKYTTTNTINTSFGSFSLSAQMTFALLREFQEELKSKNDKLDSDPHFWMPLTLDEEIYCRLVPEGHRHYKRMQRFKEKFTNLHPTSSLFGALDIGNPGYWWDFGSIQSYYANLLKLASPCSEGQMMRLFFQVDAKNSDASSNCVISDNQSCLLNCKIEGGTVHNSVLIGVTAKSVDVKDSVIINSSFNNLKADKALLYQVEEDASIKFAPGTVRADVTLSNSNETLRMYAHLNRNGKTDWDHCLPQNSLSYSELYQKIQDLAFQS